MNEISDKTYYSYIGKNERNITINMSYQKTKEMKIRLVY